MPGKLDQIILRNVFRDDRAGVTDARREADRVIAGAGADVAYGHAGLQPQDASDLAVLIEEVAAHFAGWADDRRDGTLWRRKFRRWGARRREIADVGRAGGTCDQRRNKYDSAGP